MIFILRSIPVHQRSQCNKHAKHWKKKNTKPHSKCQGKSGKPSTLSELFLRCVAWLSLDNLCWLHSLCPRTPKHSHKPECGCFSVWTRWHRWLWSPLLAAILASCSFILITAADRAQPHLVKLRNGPGHCFPGRYSTVWYCFFFFFFFFFSEVMYWYSVAKQPCLATGQPMCSRHRGLYWSGGNSLNDKKKNVFLPSWPHSQVFSYPDAKPGMRLLQMSDIAERVGGS